MRFYSLNSKLLSNVFLMKESQTEFHHASVFLSFRCVDKHLINLSTTFTKKFLSLPVCLSGQRTEQIANNFESAPCTTNKNIVPLRFYPDREMRQKKESDKLTPLDSVSSAERKKK